MKKGGDDVHTPSWHNYNATLEHKAQWSRWWDRKIGRNTVPDKSAVQLCLTEVTASSIILQQGACQNKNWRRTIAMWCQCGRGKFPGVLPRYKELQELKKCWEGEVDNCNTGNMTI